MPEPDVHPEPAAEGNAFFAAFARLVLRHRALSMLAALAVTGFMASQVATRLKVDTTAKGFLGADNEASRTLEAYETTFGSDSLVLISVDGDVFSLPFLERLRRMHEELEAIDLVLPSLVDAKAAGPAAAPDPAEESAGPIEPGDDDFGDFGNFGEEGWGDEKGGSPVEQVTSLINVRQTEWRDGGLRVGGLLDTWPEAAALPALKARATGDRTLVGRVISKDGAHTALIVRMALMAETDRNAVVGAIDEVVNRHRADDFRIWVGGPAAIDARLFVIMIGDFQRQLGYGGLLVLVLLVAIFRHPLGVVGPVLVVSQAAIWMLGSMAASGAAMTVISNILPLFLICVGMGDSVHIQSVYRDARLRGVDNHEAIVHAVASTGVPVFYTTLTTALGLLSFRFAELGAIGNMGTFGAVGVGAALVLSIVVLPVVLSFNQNSLLGARAPTQTSSPIDTLLRVCRQATAPTASGGSRRRWMGLGIGALTALAFGYGMTLIEVHHDPMRWIPKRYEVKQALDKLDDEMGGASAITLLIEPKVEHGAKNRDLMVALEKLEKHASTYDDPRNGGRITGTATSVVDVVRESHRALHGGAASEYRLPETQRGVTDMITLFQNSDLEELKRLATVDMSLTSMRLQVKWLEASAYGPLVAHMQSGIDTLVGDLAEVRLTGAVFTLFSVMENLITDLIRSFSIALLVITIVMVLLLRDVKLGLISMIPNLMPILMVMGFMGYRKIYVDGGNLMLASIAIGIAVDDTIHLLHQFKVHFAEHGRVEQAIEHAFAHAGRAMIATSVILSGGFAVFMTSELGNLRNFGLLLSLAIATALAVDLLLCPALLRTFYRDRLA